MIQVTIEPETKAEFKRELGDLVEDVVEFGAHHVKRYLRGVVRRNVSYAPLSDALFAALR